MSAPPGLHSNAYGLFWRTARNWVPATVLPNKQNVLISVRLQRTPDTQSQAAVTPQQTLTDICQIITYGLALQCKRVISI